jgi:hypothetical protein
LVIISKFEPRKIRVAATNNPTAIRCSQRTACASRWKCEAL